MGVLFIECGFFFISSLYLSKLMTINGLLVLSAHGGMTTSEYPVLNSFARVHEGRKHIDFLPKEKGNKGQSSSHSNLCKINA